MFSNLRKNLEQNLKTCKQVQIKIPSLSLTAIRQHLGFSFSSRETSNSQCFWVCENQRTMVPMFFFINYLWFGIESPHNCACVTLEFSTVWLPHASIQLWLVSLSHCCLHMCTWKCVYAFWTGGERGQGKKLSSSILYYLINRRIRLSFEFMLFLLCIQTYKILIFNKGKVIFKN